jgi:hypothetical protein
LTNKLKIKNLYKKNIIETYNFKIHEDWAKIIKTLKIKIIYYKSSSNIIKKKIK